MVALADALHPGADFDDDARALVAENRRKQTFRVRAGQGEIVGVANAGRLDLDQNLAFTRAFEIDLGDFERLSCGDGDGGAGLHGRAP